MPDRIDLAEWSRFEFLEILKANKLRFRLARHNRLLSRSSEDKAKESSPY